MRAIADAGTRVEVILGDIADAADLDRMLATIARDLPPLRGVFHGAMVLADQRLAALDEASLERVLRPKAQGAWNLHVPRRTCRSITSCCFPRSRRCSAIRSRPITLPPMRCSMPWHISRSGRDCPR